ncbi:hypothetical protein YH64_009430 [Achromobacter sp. LC458]|uniref:hypothetical protein n=1 Tax=Achromobacter sp. LC458 TaxID=1120623 RepID=UPI000B0F0440|nr:hypothetical protein [Achromobacter sp. LC458]TRM53310.1 hypothetical protein YH64_009430 [Achromobacter sp. LC458]
MNTEWKPIASAPKDGTEILAWRHDCGQFIASYTSADSFPMTQDELDAWDEETLFAKDWFTQWPQALRLEGSEVPTLWQPMPTDPCSTCNGHGAVGNILNAEPCPDCSPAPTSHPIPTGATGEDERQAFEAWHKREFGSYVPEVTHHYNRWLGWKGRASVAAPAAGDALLPNLDLDAAAKTLAECMDYPWAHMPEQGREQMRQNAKTVITAAIAQQKGEA